MKPPAFDYVAPTTADEALGALSKAAGEGRLLAGGQSLIPLLNFRLSAPAILIDLSRVADLDSVSITPSHIRIASMTRTARLLEPDVRLAFPALTGAARHVAHPQIRSRGTVGGSIAHADPAAELPAFALLAEASVHLVGPSGPREVLAGAFFKDMFQTACEWNEIVVRIDFPLAKAAAGWGFREFARRQGDFAIAGVGTMLTLQDGTVSWIVLVVFGVEATPRRVPGAESTLLGRSPSAAAVSNARSVLEEEIAPIGSDSASADYKRHVAGVLFERAVADALARTV
jgi:carbon-monoxide dehydrogenase medium subunit